jgi:hypothetical protein
MRLVRRSARSYRVPSGTLHFLPFHGEGFISGIKPL